MDTHPLLRIALALIVGILLATTDLQSSLLPLQGWIGAAAGFLLLTLCCRRWPRLQSIGILLTTVCMGGGLGTHQLQQTVRHLPAGNISYRAVCLSEPQAKGKVARIDLLVTAVDGRQLQRPMKIKAALLRDTVDNRWLSLHTGSWLQATSLLQPPTNYPGSRFNYVRYLYSHGFAAQTFIYYKDWTALQTDGSPAADFHLPVLTRLRLHALTLRRQLLASYRLPGNDEQAYGVVAAMTLGDKSSVSQSLTDDYSIAGGSHILALSGLHLGIIYGLLTMLLNFRGRLRWLTQPLILLAVWSFVTLVGLPASAIRSALLITLYSICLLARRKKISVNALALAAIIMLTVQPLELWDVGFQLSFLAVLAILVFYPTFFHLLTLSHPVSRWIWGMACVSLAAQLGTAPLVAYYFGRFSCYFLLTNFIVIPLATFILYSAVLFFLCSPLPFLQQLPATLLTVLSQLMNDFLGRIARLPGASIEGLQPSVLQLSLLYLLIASVSVIVYTLQKVSRLHKLDAFHHEEERRITEYEP